MLLTAAEIYGGVSIGMTIMYYMMTDDFWGALLLAVVWPYIVCLGFRERL